MGKYKLVSENVSAVILIFLQSMFKWKHFYNEFKQRPTKYQMFNLGQI